jgi:PAS domain S-box-containing protein
MSWPYPNFAPGLPRSIRSPVVRSRIAADQVAIAYRYASRGHVAGMFAATVVWFLLAPSAPFSRLSTWYIAFCIVGLTRMWVADAYANRPADDVRSGFWAALLLVGSVVSAFLSGLCGAFLFPSAAINYQDAIVLFIGAAAAGVGALSSPLLAPSIGFILPVTLPFAIVMFQRGDSWHFSLGVGTLLYVAVLLGIGNRNYRNTVEALALRHKNDELEQTLTHTKLQTEATSRELESQIAERERAEARVREHRQRLDLMIQQTPLACIEWNVDFTIKEWNPAAERIFGFARDQAIGCDGLQLLVPAELQGVVRKQLREFIGGTGPEHGTLRNVTRDGRTVLCEWYNTAVRESDGRVTDVVSLVLDVTERIRLDRMKNEFIRTVSHEIRTPLTSIQGAVGLLSGGVAGDLSQQAQSLVEIAETNSAQLLHLIDDLLDMEKLQSGRIRFRQEPVDLARLVADTVTRSRRQAAETGRRIECAPAPEGLWVTGDEARLMQALSELITNAVKFSPPGEPVRVTVSRKDGGQARIAVIDRGPGIPPEFRDRVYDTFTQADASNARPREGRGLGLAIAKRIVEGHGGRLSFDSELNAGTQFFLDLPLATRTSGETADAVAG